MSSFETSRSLSVQPLWNDFPRKSPPRIARNGCVEAGPPRLHMTNLSWNQQLFRTEVNGRFARSAGPWI